ncbi:transcriptional repressor LexA [bacterium]|nr:transcriptional repressor LexA [bacterium]
MADTLTDRQRSVLMRIGEGIRSHGYPPTFREIGEKEGIQSTNGVRSILDALEKKGYITRHRYRSRAIELTQIARHLVLEPYIGSEEVEPHEGGAKTIELSEMVYTSERVISIPIYGEAVAAGQPLLAENNIRGHIAIDADYAPKGETFALRVKGQSMIEAGIHDGDVVFCRKQDEATPGDIIVALIGEEATVKYYHPEKGRIILKPANEYMGPIIVDENVDEFRILGKVVSLFRRY